ncbi:lysine N(6)-hydroxylase/L-ornithine N(5)-oxygenase family protein [Haloprofundus salinisoli]|uniref:lysine N(6)-hydroxylase/L-ornithine N(5)-oxygenase family protein n=1 Tax=Haloprofundus salinisoli TaxID=2876193 RepID=UPI001CCE1A1E|nr:lysine N(6)-hydroxylase/L-ornithine N(5)-oxygenase family protein [Haloprofundus salinisoli]
MSGAADDAEADDDAETVEADTYDLLGVGLGPFNLGLAALADGADDGGNGTGGVDLDAVFLEQKPEFAWHEGMLVEGATLEVPFVADLVTLADPSNPHSYLNFLRETGRIYEFYFYERFHIPRREYNEYCKWVAERVDACEFSRRVVEVSGGEDGPFVVRAEDPESGEHRVYRARDLVVGVGSVPYVPEAFGSLPDSDVFHTASYLYNRERVLDAEGITVVGSGQSAAEVFQDLLERQADRGYRLDWLTRSDGFFPMEYSKLGLQHFTPEYARYFYDLPQSVSDDLLDQQDLLYKGIDPDTSDEIYETLYERSIGDADPDVGLLAATEVTDIDPAGDGRYRLRCRHREKGTRFAHETEVVVLGTGYRRPTPAFLAPLEPHVDRDDRGRFRVQRGYALKTDGLTGRIFVQNAELHTHGVGAPDLGLGCYRNAVILDQLVDDSPYPVDRDTVYQAFSPERFVSNSPVSELLRPEQHAPSDD